MATTYNAPLRSVNSNSLQPANQQTNNYPSWRASIAMQFVNNIASGAAALPQSWDTSLYGDPRQFANTGLGVNQAGGLTTPGVPAVVFANVLRWVDSGAWESSTDDTGWMVSVAGARPAPSPDDYTMDPEYEAQQYAREQTAKNYNLNLRQQEFAEQKFAIGLILDQTRAYSQTGGGGSGGGGYASQIQTNAQEAMTAYQAASLALQEKLGLGQLGLSQGQLDLEKLKAEADKLYKDAVLALQNKQFDASTDQWEKSFDQGKTQFEKSFDQQAKQWSEQFGLTKEQLATSKEQFAKQFDEGRRQFGETFGLQKSQFEQSKTQWQKDFDQKSRQWADQYGLSREQFETTKSQFDKSFGQAAKQFDENKALTLKQMDQTWQAHLDDLNQRKSEAASSDDRARIDQLLRQSQFDYQKQRDTIAAQLDQQKFEEGQRQFNETLGFQKEQAGFQRATQMADTMLKRGEITARLNADPNDMVARSYFTHEGVNPTGTAVNIFSGQESGGPTTLPEVMAGNAGGVTATGGGLIPAAAEGGYTTAKKMIIGDHPGGAPNPEIVENPEGAPIYIHSRLTEGTNMPTSKGLPRFAYGTAEGPYATSNKGNGPVFNPRADYYDPSPYAAVSMDAFGAGNSLGNELELNNQTQQRFFDEATGRAVWDPRSNSWVQTYDPTPGEGGQGWNAGRRYMNPFDIRTEESGSGGRRVVYGNTLPNATTMPGISSDAGAATTTPPLPPGFTRVQGAEKANSDGTLSLIDPASGARVQPNDVRRDDGTYWRYMMADALSGSKPGWVPVTPGYTMINNIEEWNATPAPARDQISSGKPTFYVIAPGFTRDSAGEMNTIGGAGGGTMMQESGWERLAGLPLARNIAGDNGGTAGSVFNTVAGTSPGGGLGSVVYTGLPLATSNKSPRAPGASTAPPPFKAPLRGPARRWN